MDVHVTRLVICSNVGCRGLQMAVLACVIAQARAACLEGAGKIPSEHTMVGWAAGWRCSRRAPRGEKGTNVLQFCHHCLF